MWIDTFEITSIIKGCVGQIADEEGHCEPDTCGHETCGALDDLLALVDRMEAPEA